MNMLKIGISFRTNMQISAPTLNAAGLILAIGSPLLVAFAQTGQLTGIAILQHWQANALSFALTFFGIRLLVRDRLSMYYQVPAAAIFSTATLWACVAYLSIRPKPLRFEMILPYLLGALPTILLLWLLHKINPARNEIDK